MQRTSLSRRSFLKLAGAGSASLIAANTLPALAQTAARKPNILLILADDLGYGSIGCQGYTDASTPNIDSIAANGVRFTSGYVTCPVCSPTRAGLMTGRYQQRFGHEDNPGPPPVASANFGLPEDQKTLGDYLKAEGYKTGIIGKWHLGHRAACHPNKRGFDEFFGFLTGAHDYEKTLVGTDNPLLRGTEEIKREEYLTDALAREAVSFIEKHKADPFLLYLPFNAVHAPLQSPDRFKNAFKSIKEPRRRSYAGMMKAMDEGIGEVLAKLRLLGLEENTLVFFIGDNGGYPLPGGMPNKPFSGFKGDMLEGGVRVPYLLQWKSKLAAGTVYNSPVSSLDVLPTALAGAGAKVPDVAEGVDLVGLLNNKQTGLPHKPLFWRWIDKSAARVGDWKLVRNGDGSEKLFNLAADPGEKKDLAASEPARLKELQTAYNEWDAKNIKPKWLDGRRKPGKAGVAEQ